MEVGLAFGIVSAVAAVVSALTDGISLFKQWKAKRNAAKAAEEATTEQSLVRNPPAVREQYDFGDLTLGGRFRRGDEHSLREMRVTLEKFRRTLREFVKAMRGAIEPQVLILRVASDHAPDQAITTLTQLYQRLSVAAPIARHFHRSSEEAAAVQREYCLQPNDVLVVQHPAPRSIGGHRCPVCLASQEPTPEIVYDRSGPSIVSETAVSLRDALNRIPHCGENLTLPVSEPRVTANQLRASLQDTAPFVSVAQLFPTEAGSLSMRRGVSVLAANLGRLSDSATGDSRSRGSTMRDSSELATTRNTLRSSIPSTASVSLSTARSSGVLTRNSAVLSNRGGHWSSRGVTTSYASSSSRRDSYFRGRPAINGRSSATSGSASVLQRNRERLSRPSQSSTAGSNASVSEDSSPCTARIQDWLCMVSDNEVPPCSIAEDR